jgi:hypothetical protein
MTIKLNTVFGKVRIRLTEPNKEGCRSGVISECAFHDERSPSINAVESLILAHACAGVDVAAPAYISGIETALEAIANES